VPPPVRRRRRTGLAVGLVLGALILLAVLVLVATLVLKAVGGSAGRTGDGPAVETGTYAFEVPGGWRDGTADLGDLTDRSRGATIRTALVPSDDTWRWR
jgi:hypothetical protein